MERLFFELQNDKHFYRQAQLLLYLDNKKRVAKTADLVQELNCSMPTLRSDVDELNTVLPKQVYIEHHHQYGYELICNVDISIYSFIMEMAKKTTVFQLIDNLFHGEVYSFHETAEKLFICESSLRKLIKHLNITLENFRISIATTTVDFVGDESDIRFFLFAFYTDFRDFSIENSDYGKQTKAFIDLLNIRSSELHSSYFRTMIWTMIIKERLINGHLISLKSNLKREIVERESFKNYYESICKTLNVTNPPLEESIWDYVVTLHCVSYSNQDVLASSDGNHKAVYSYEEDQKIVDKINQFLSLVFPKEVVESDKLDKMRAYLINISLLSQLSPLFEMSSPLVLNKIKKSNQELFQKWRAILKKYSKKMLYPIHYFDDVAGTLSLFHSLIDNEYEKKNDLVIIFAFQGESGYDDYLIQNTKPLVPENIQVIYIFDELVTTEMIEKTRASLVVCNYDILNIADAPCRVINLSTPPSVEELRNLRKTIVELAELGIIL